MPARSDFPDWRASLLIRTLSRDWLAGRLSPAPREPPVARLLEVPPVREALPVRAAGFELELPAELVRRGGVEEVLLFTLLVATGVLPVSSLTFRVEPGPGAFETGLFLICYSSKLRVND